ASAPPADRQAREHELALTAAELRVLGLAVVRLRLREPLDTRHLDPASSVAVDGALELRLRHLRTSLDVLVFPLPGPLRLRAAAGPAVRPQATAPAGRDVPGRRRARGPGLPGAGPLLVHRSSGDLLRRVLVAPSLPQAL